MKTIVMYDPAMCCSTGVCGASVDKELLRVATVIETLNRKGAGITRYNLASQPNAFVENQLINDYLKQYGPEILPITLVDGEPAKTKTYPSNEEFTEWTGIKVAFKLKKKGCCCSDGGCC
ncbi:MAG: arsenite efflux transporter metallochaperone ArsD [Pelosinus sp.]|nr:arsenite efflux transporter metallochaperone ArsD [Pelosinus sp.]